MIDSAVARTAATTTDAGRIDNIARVLGSTVADPLARMQFEYRAATVPRRFSADGHESAALRLAAQDFIPDQTRPGVWAVGVAAGLAGPPAREPEVTGSAAFDWPAGIVSLFDTVHGSMAA